MQFGWCSLIFWLFMLFQESVQGLIKFHHTKTEGIWEENVQVAA
jgi:hypothetical protein